jgi:hypothetical protein
VSVKFKQNLDHFLSLMGHEEATASTFYGISLNIKENIVAG